MQTTRLTKDSYLDYIKKNFPNSTLKKQNKMVSRQRDILSEDIQIASKHMRKGATSLIVNKCS